VSPSPSRLLPEGVFRLYAVSARFPQNLASQVPWQERQRGVYDCRWGLDTVGVIVASRLPPEPHNAPLHLFSAAPELVALPGGSTGSHVRQAGLFAPRRYYTGTGKICLHLPKKWASAGERTNGQICRSLNCC
jgi:hypothetical protein